MTAGELKKGQCFTVKGWDNGLVLTVKKTAQKLIICIQEDAKILLDGKGIIAEADGFQYVLPVVAEVELV